MVNVQSDLNLGPLDHVGIAVADLEKAEQFYAQCLGATPEPQIFEDENQKVRIRFMRVADLRIELLAPLGEVSPVHAMLKRGISLYHICHEVSDLEGTLARLTRDGAKLISPPKPAIAFEHRRVAFVMAQGLMVELVEAAKA